MLSESEVALGRPPLKASIIEAVIIGVSHRKSLSKVFDGSDVERLIALGVKLSTATHAQGAIQRRNQTVGESDERALRAL